MLRLGLPCNPFFLFLRFPYKRQIGSGLILGLLLISHSFAYSSENISSSSTNLRRGWQEPVQPSYECIENARRLSPSDNPSPISLEGNKNHCYKIALNAGVFVKITVEQMGNDVAVSLFEPDELRKPSYKNVLPAEYEIKEIDTPTGTSNSEPFSHVASVSGDHILIIRSILNKEQSGDYAVKLTLRRAEVNDEAYIKAERSFIKGWGMCALARDLKQLEQGVNLLKASYSLALEFNDPQLEHISLEQLSNYDLILATYRSGNDGVEEAISYADKYVEACRQRSRYQDLAATLYNKGLLYLVKFRDIKKADECFNEIYLQFDKLSDELKVQPLLGRYASQLNHAGARYYERGEYSYAMSYYNKASSLAEYARTRGVILKEEPSITNNIGTIHISVGDFDTAKKSFEDAYQRLSNQQDSHDFLYGKAWITVNLGLTYFNLGRYDLAISFYHKAIETAKEYKNSLNPSERAFPDDPEIAAISNLGAALYRDGKRESAIKHLEEAISIARGISPNEEGRALMNLGRILSDAEQYAEAVSKLDLAIPILTNSQNKRALAYTLANKAFALNKLGKVEEALKLLGDSLKLHRSLNNRSGEIGALYVLATIERDRGDLKKALEYINHATDKLEPLRSTVSDASLRAAFSATSQPTFDLKIDLLMQMHNEAPADGFALKAFETHESSRARVFLELISLRGTTLRREVGQEIVEREFRLRREATLYPRSLKGDSQNELLKAAELDTKLKQTVSEIIDGSPRLRSIAQSLKASEIQKNLEPDLLLLEYRLSPKQGTLWAVTRNSIEAHELGPSETIKAAAEKVINGLSSRGRKVEFETPEERMERITRGERGLPQASRELSDILLSPVRDRLKGRRLVIVTDGILQYVPFGALPVPSKVLKPTSAPYLTEENEILYLPSASTLSQLTQLTKERKPSKSVALFAPRFNGVENDQKKSVETTSGGEKPKEASASQQSTCLDNLKLPLQKLTFNIVEAESISNLLKRQAGLKPRNVLLKRGAAATKQLIQSDEMSHYSVIHLATHGIYNTERPDCSGIVLAPHDRSGNKNETWGYLAMPETFDLKLSSDLVVLSACETAVGKDVQGEGLIGITRGFLYSGASRVTSSLWIVNTEANSVLMQNLYKGIFLKGQRPSMALQEAQKSMIRNPKYKHPYYWAGFVQQGIW